MKNLWSSLLLAIFLVSACSSSSPGPTEYVVRTRAETIPADAVKVLPEDDPFPPILHSPEWEDPIPLPAPINTAGAEDSPFINLDGDRFFFWFTPDPAVPVEEQLIDGVTGNYMSIKVAGEWQEPQMVITWDPDEVAMDGCSFFMDNVLWFCSVRATNFGEIDFWTIRFENGQWIDLQNAGERLNEEYTIGEMHLSANGSELYFHGTSPGNQAGYDLYVTFLIGGEWTEPVSIAALNTEANEGWPYLSEDGNELWFLRTYQGYPAIFRSHRISGEWTEAELIVSQFAAEPTLDREGNLYFVHHFIQDGVMLDADIYVAYRK